MIVYRIASKKYADLKGIGGLYFAGRWHAKGVKVIYTAESRSLAVYEKLIQVTSFKVIPNDLVIMEISVPESSLIIVSNEILVKGWNDFPHKSETIEFGTNFLLNSDNLILKIPSAHIPKEFNFVINPSHPLINDCKIISINVFEFDNRLH